MGKHVITLYISIKNSFGLLVTWKFQNGMPQRHGRGSAPQEQSDWRKPSGHTEIRLFKTTTKFGTLSLFLPRSSTCSLVDDPEASVALDTRLNIGLSQTS